jgi:hypothetical protein
MMIQQNPSKLWITSGNDKCLGQPRATINWGASIDQRATSWLRKFVTSQIMVNWADLHLFPKDSGCTIKRKSSTIDYIAKTREEWCDK